MVKLIPAFLTDAVYRYLGLRDRGIDLRNACKSAASAVIK